MGHEVGPYLGLDEIESQSPMVILLLLVIYLIILFGFIYLFVLFDLFVRIFC